MGTQELVIILVIVLVIFGGRKLPDLARSMGDAIGEFRRSTKDAMADDERPAEGDATGSDRA